MVSAELLLVSHDDSDKYGVGMASFTRILGMDSAQAKKICNDAVLSMKDKTIHIYFKK